MTPFLIGALLLLLIASAIVLFRRDPRPRAADLDDPNLRWYRQRRDELADADPVLVEETELRLLEDGALGETESGTGPETSLGRGPMLALCLLMAGLAVGVYQYTGALEDVLIYEDLVTITPESGETARQALVARIEGRSRVREDNLQYLSLLGRMYMAAEDFPAASDAFGRLVSKAPEDPQALAMAAQARFLAADRQLDEQSQLYAEQALAVDPSQRTALGLLGMASFETGSYAAAVTYWERLRAQEAPGSPGYEMLGEVLTLARERGGLPVVDAAVEPEAVAGGVGISVELSLDESLGANPEAVVFVFARQAEMAGGMPVAVRRLQAGQLPMTLRLADADAMAGQLLSEAGAVVVSAQISANGQPGLANAVYSGVSEPITAAEDAKVSILLRPVDRQG